MISGSTQSIAFDTVADLIGYWQEGKLDRIIAMLTDATMLIYEDDGQEGVEYFDEYLRAQCAEALKDRAGEY